MRCSTLNPAHQLPKEPARGSILLLGMVLARSSCSRGADALSLTVLLSVGKQKGVKQKGTVKTTLHPYPPGTGVRALRPWEEAALQPCDLPNNGGRQGVSLSGSEKRGQYGKGAVTNAMHSGVPSSEDSGPTLQKGPTPGTQPEGRDAPGNDWPCQAFGALLLSPGSGGPVEALLAV